MGRVDVVRVGVVAAVALVACSGTPETREGVRLCGARFELARSYRAVDFGDEFGDVEGGPVWSVLPDAETATPSRLEDVFVAPEGFTVEDEVDEMGPNRVSFGRFRSVDGSCTVWLMLASGSSLAVSMPGIDVEWVVTAGEGDA